MADREKKKGGGKYKKFEKNEKSFLGGKKKAFFMVFKRLSFGVKIKIDKK